MEKIPHLKINCWTCSKLRTTPVCLGGELGCNKTKLRIDNPDSTFCDSYCPSKRALFSAIVRFGKFHECAADVVSEMEHYSEFAVTGDSEKELVGEYARRIKEALDSES